jgi:hypothetical protein
MSSWQNVGRVAPERLGEARMLAHYGAQWLARAARAYIPARPADEHTNLGWDDALSALTTHALPDGSMLGLRISDLTLLACAAQSGKLSEIGLGGRTDADIRRELGAMLAARGLDAGSLDAPAPYEMPPHPVGSGAPYAVDGLAAAFTELAAWYADADRALGAERTRVVARGMAAPPVRCWPHHFDVDTLLAFGSPKPDRWVGIGFSPGDHYYAEPYFYVSSYPAPDVATLPALPRIGHWHSHEFTAAVATRSTIVAAADRAAEVTVFLNAATDILLQVAARTPASW